MLAFTESGNSPPVCGKQMPATKICTKCEKSFPATTDFFRIACLNSDGLNGYCRPCKKESDREYRTAHHAKVLAAQHTYVAKCREKIRAAGRVRMAKWRLENPEENKARRAAFAAVNPLYMTWAGMMARCTNSKDLSWKNYGGANPPVNVCERWSDPEHGYEKFCADMGARPTAQHTLSRYLDIGDYEPTNVEWATRAEQEAEKKGKISMSEYREFKLNAAKAA